MATAVATKGRSLHLCSQQLLAVCRTVATALLYSLLEVLAFLGYDYQGLLVLTERANLLALRWDVILFECAVTHTLSVENSREESAHKYTIRRLGKDVWNGV